MTPKLVAWADVIFVMKRAHLRRLRERYRAELDRQRVVSLGIPDDYAYMDPVLVARLEDGVPRHLGTVSE